MPIKILRLGLTESSLLIAYWLNNYKNDNNQNIINGKEILIKWLYTTSGYYDKSIISNYMDATHTDNDTEIYIKYMELLLEFIKEANIFNYTYHGFISNEQLNEFKLFNNVKKESYINQEIVFDFIKNKKILIISPFSPLIKDQLENGNCKKIYNNTPSIDTIDTYKFPYTFFNKGPHNNILETIEYNYNEILTNINNDYDSVLISCGAYSCLIAKKFYDIGKNVLTIGGDMQGMFGILNKRQKNKINKENIELLNKEYWIVDIPEEYKPTDYEKIEDGCYW